MTEDDMPHPETANGSDAPTVEANGIAPDQAVDDGTWMPEVLDMVRQRLAVFLGPDPIAPMFYDDAITSIAHRAAFGKLPEEMYPEGSLLHRLRQAEAERDAVIKAWDRNIQDTRRRVEEARETASTLAGLLYVEVEFCGWCKRPLALPASSQCPANLHEPSLAALDTERTT